MRKNSGGIVATIIWIIWLGALQGKKLLPETLGSSWFQWSCAAIVAILIPVGTLIAIRRFSCTDQRRSGLGLLIACIFPLVINLTIFGVGGPMMARTAVSLSSMNDRDTEMIARFTRQAVEPEEFKQRQRAAWALYTLFGVQGAWRDNSGALTIYSPTAEGETTWRETRETNSKLAATTNLINAQLKQFPWLFALNLGCFVVILFGGLMRQTYKKADRTLHPTAGNAPF